jgi:hypothetical protein
VSLANPSLLASDPVGPATTTREAIVDALKTVGTLNVYPSSPDNPQAWDAFPRWALTNYTGGRLGWIAVHEYDVLVVLPAGYEPDTVTQGDSLLDLVATALATVGVVQTAEPIRATFDTGQGVPALRVRVVPRLNPHT